MKSYILLEDFHIKFEMNKLPLKEICTQLFFLIKCCKNEFNKYNWNIVESGIKHHNPNP